MKVKFNTKINKICKICGFGSNPKELSAPLSKIDLSLHMYAHDSKK